MTTILIISALTEPAGLLPYSPLLTVTSKTKNSQLQETRVLVFFHCTVFNDAIMYVSILMSE